MTNDAICAERLGTERSHSQAFPEAPIRENGIYLDPRQRLSAMIGRAGRPVLRGGDDRSERRLRRVHGSL